MTTKHQTLPCLAALLALTCAGVQAQSVDSLLDKLVDKGVLTVDEANDLREEADKGFTSAYQLKSGMPDWVTALKINGDVRARYENFSSGNPGFNDRNRFRYRLRAGITASMTDNFEVGFRLTSSERSDNFGGDPISGNTTFQDNGSKKFVFIDLAYAKWTPINTADWSGAFSVGKIENPFVFSDMVFDGDYTPEGMGQQFGYNLSESHNVKLNLGQFVLDEIGANDEDPYLLGAQLRVDSKWSQHIATSFGVGALGITNPDRLTTTIPAAGAATSAVPNGAAGNEHVGSPAPLPAPAGTATTATLAHEFNPVIVDGALTYTLESFPMYNAAFPIRLAAEYMHNPGADDENNGYSVGVTFGKAGKRKLWEVGYRWKELQANAWWEELVDSDFGAFYGGNSRYNPGRGAGYQSGTNIRGHIVKAAYSPYDSLTLGATAFITEVINEVPAGSESDMFRLQLDAVWKF